MADQKSRSKQQRAEHKRFDRGRPPIDKGTDPVILNAKVKPETKEAFKARAAAHDINTSELVRLVVTAYLDDDASRDAVEAYIGRL